MYAANTLRIRLVRGRRSVCHGVCIDPVSFCIMYKHRQTDCGIRFPTARFAYFASPRISVERKRERGVRYRGRRVWCNRKESVRRNLPSVNNNSPRETKPMATQSSASHTFANAGVAVFIEAIYAASLLIKARDRREFSSLYEYSRIPKLLPPNDINEHAATRARTTKRYLRGTPRKPHHSSRFTLPPLASRKVSPWRPTLSRECQKDETLPLSIPCRPIARTKSAALPHRGHNYKKTKRESRSERGGYVEEGEEEASGTNGSVCGMRCEPLQGRHHLRGCGEAGPWLHDSISRPPVSSPIPFSLRSLEKQPTRGSNRFGIE